MLEQLQPRGAGRCTPIKDEAPGVWCAKGLGEGLSEGLYGTASQVVPQGARRAAELTMSSREIAELTGKRHDNVMADCRAMLTELLGDGGVLKFQETYVHPQNGQTYPCFSLPKDLTITLVSGYSVQMRHRIVTRWIELEAQQHAIAPVLPRTYKEALLALVAAEEEKEAQRLQLEQQRPAVEFVGRYVDSTGTVGVRQAAKTLRANERLLVSWLLERGVMYRLAGRLTPTAPHLEAGRFQVKTGAAGNGHAYTETRITPKGMEWLAQQWGEHVAGIAPRAKKGRA